MQTSGRDNLGSLSLGTSCRYQMRRSMDSSSASERKRETPIQGSGYDSLGTDPARSGRRQSPGRRTPARGSKGELCVGQTPGAPADHTTRTRGRRLSVRAHADPKDATEVVLALRCAQQRRGGRPPRRNTAIRGRKDADRAELQPGPVNRAWTAKRSTAVRRSRRPPRILGAGWARASRKDGFLR